MILVVETMNDVRLLLLFDKGEIGYKNGQKWNEIKNISCFKADVNDEEKTTEKTKSKKQNSRCGMFCCCCWSLDV